MQNLDKITVTVHGVLATRTKALGRFPCDCGLSGRSDEPIASCAPP
jgi:hypothetical protein